MRLNLVRHLPPAVVWRAGRWRLENAQTLRAAGLGAVIALVVGVLVIRPEMRFLDDKRAELERSWSGQRLASEGKTDSVLAAERDFLAYFDTFRLDATSTPALLRDLSSVAASKQVKVELVTESPRELRDLGLAGLEFNTSMTGTYPALRAVIGEMMQRYPNLGVESLNISKESAGSRLKAEIKWILVAPSTRKRSV